MKRLSAAPVLVILVALFIAFMGVMSVFHGSILANYTFGLSKTGSGWVGKVRVVNADLKNALDVRLSRIKLNGVDADSEPPPAHLEPGGTRVFEIRFPSQAAAENAVANLTFWASVGNWASGSSTLTYLQALPSKGGDPEPTEPGGSAFLSLFHTRLGWVCRFSFRSTRPQPITAAVEKCWLNGHGPLMYPGDWILQPGQSVARDVLFPEEAAHRGQSAEFQGNYQFSWDDHYDLRPIRQSLNPETGPAH